VLHPATPVSQVSDQWEKFSAEERTVCQGTVIMTRGVIFTKQSGLGQDAVRVYGIRRQQGFVEFGIGNTTPPILAWVRAEFFKEWNVLYGD
jgi:hypothetical protein